ncbi:MAG: family 43 glycosylhydrolase, partial [Lachnospiraceae bacterium]|nr:family 43 glycosylhydrolase [Lachnospiraceae bacterium]
MTAMKGQVYNPYLPLDTYIPDGEPHVYGNGNRPIASLDGRSGCPIQDASRGAALRLYIYGSHDEEGGTAFCVLPYECWSAPVDDLTDWRCEGTIYRAEQDPDFGPANRYMYAPDVVCGADGRYYLYYAMSGEGCFTGPIHVAVCDTPAGKYEYYGAVRTADGKELNRYITFDPAVMNDNGRYWLYYGWSLEKADVTANIPQEQLIPVEVMLFGRTEEEIRACPHSYMGANAVELAEDMLTVLGEPSRIVPGQFESFGTSFEGHAFFEASSMRKIGDTYYFIYSSQAQHELCYATSQYPDRDFQYGGVIVSNGDIGYPLGCSAQSAVEQADRTEADREALPRRKPEDRLAKTGNNHGSIVEVNGQWYVFYHRQTHKTTYSRQGCAEPITIASDGSIAQVEMTSCGLNGGPLAASGVYPAAICCNLTNGRMPHQTTEPIEEVLPHITCQRSKEYIDSCGLESGSALQSAGAVRPETESDGGGSFQAEDGRERFLTEIGDGTWIGYKY